MWAADTASIVLNSAWAYLVAILEWFSRFVLAWELSIIRDSDFCVRAWNQVVANAGRVPNIMNTDQGTEFCSADWQQAVRSDEVRIIQDGRDLALNNLVIKYLRRKRSNASRSSYTTTRCRPECGKD